MEDKEVRCRKIKEALGKVLDEYVNLYKSGKEVAAHRTLEFLTSGRIILVMFPNSQEINVNYSGAWNGIGDIGTVIGSVSTEHFGVDDAVNVIDAIVEAWKNP